MTLENSDMRATTTISVNESKEDLSHAVFANPVEFLTVLKNNYSKIDHATPGTPNLITKTDLKVYSEEGDDPQVRAAAKVAYLHFDELQELAGMPAVNGRKENDHTINHNSTKAISRSDLDIDLDMAKGRTWPYVAGHVSQGAAYTAVLGGATAGLGVVTALSAVDGPVVPAMAGAATLLAAVATARLGEATHKAPGLINSLAKRDQATLASWPEINAPIIQK